MIVVRAGFWLGAFVVRRSKADIAGVVADPAGATSTRMPGIDTKPVVAVD
jgi:hypothetical protein